jgi:hypothetical protein
MAARSSCAAADGWLARCAALGEPRLDLIEGRQVQRIDPALPQPPHPNQAGGAQDLEMLRDTDLVRMKRSATSLAAMSLRASNSVISASWIG